MSRRRVAPREPQLRISPLRSWFERSDVVIAAAAPESHSRAAFAPVARSGSAYVSSAIGGLVEVTGIDLRFPGYTQGGDTPVEYVQVRQPMSEDDIKTFCDAIPSSTKLGVFRGPRSAPAPARAAAVGRLSSLPRLLPCSKTAKAHLNRVYRKLQITRRAQIADALTAVSEDSAEDSSAGVIAIS